MGRLGAGGPEEVGESDAEAARWTRLAMGERPFPEQVDALLERAAYGLLPAVGDHESGDGMHRPSSFRSVVRLSTGNA